MIKICEQCETTFTVSEVNQSLKKDKPTGVTSYLICSNCGAHHKPTKRGRFRLMGVILGIYTMSLSLDGIMVGVNPIILSAFRILLIFAIYVKGAPYFYTFERVEPSDIRT